MRSSCTVALPTATVRDRDRVLVHGSTGSRWLRRLAAGAPASLAVTAFDGLVVARSAFESSMRYRSAVLFGQCTAITMKRACAALAIDMKNPCGPHGYAVKPKISSSLNAATRKCYEFGGKECVIRAWACDARG